MWPLIKFQTYFVWCWRRQRGKSCRGPVEVPSGGMACAPQSLLQPYSSPPGDRLKRASREGTVRYRIGPVLARPDSADARATQTRDRKSVLIAQRTEARPRTRHTSTRRERKVTLQPSQSSPARVISCLGNLRGHPA